MSNTVNLLGSEQQQQPSLPQLKKSKSITVLMLTPSERLWSTDLVMKSLLGPLPGILGISSLFPDYHYINVALTLLGILGILSALIYTVWEWMIFGVKDYLIVEVVMLIVPCASWIIAHSYQQSNHLQMVVDSSRDINPQRFWKARKMYIIEQSLMIFMSACAIVAVEVMMSRKDQIEIPILRYILRCFGWSYLFGSFVFMVSLLDLVCNLLSLQIFRFNELLKDEEVATSFLFEEYFRLRDLLSRTSHEFRFFLMSLLTCTTVGVLLGLYIFFEQTSAITQRPSVLVLLCIVAAEHTLFSMILIRSSSKVTHLCEKVPGLVATMRAAYSLSLLVQSNHGKVSLRRSMDSINGAGANMLWKDAGVHAPQLEVLYNCVRSNPMGISLYGISMSRDTLMKVASLYMALTLFLTQRILSENVGRINIT